MVEQPTTCSDLAPATPSPAPPAVASPRRRLRWILLLLLLISAAWFARFAYLRMTVRPSPRPEYWEARIAALDRPFDAALTPEQAFALLSKTPWNDVPIFVATFGRYGGWTNMLTGPWDDSRPDITGATAVLVSDGFRKTADELHQALRHGWAVYQPTAAYGTTRAWLTGHTRWATWLVMHSRWARERGPGIEAAVADWLDAIRLGRQADRSRTEQGIFSVCDAYGHAALEMMVTGVEEHDPIDILRLAGTIDEIVGPPLECGALLEGDHLLRHMHLETIYAREGGDWLVLSEVPANPPTWSYMPPTAASSTLWNLTSPLFHDLPTARRQVDDSFATLHGCTSLASMATLPKYPYVEGSQFGPTPLDGIPSQCGRFGPWETLRLHWRTLTGLNAAVTMLALAEFHRTHNRYPDTLAELLPDFLPRLPIDYADGQTLRYRPDGDGYLLYSISDNGVDDGGAGPGWTSDYWYWRMPLGKDVVFSRTVRPPRQEN